MLCRDIMGLSGWKLGHLKLWQKAQWPRSPLRGSPLPSTPPDASASPTSKRGQHLSGSGQPRNLPESGGAGQQKTGICLTLPFLQGPSDNKHHHQHLPHVRYWETRGIESNTQVERTNEPALPGPQFGQSPKQHKASPTGTGRGSVGQAGLCSNYDFYKKIWNLRTYTSCTW